MQIRVSDPALLPALIADLRSDPSTVVRRVGDDTIEASVVGSYRPAAMRTILAVRVWEWQAARAASGEDVIVELL